MPDDSELDYIRTFLGEVMTGYTIKQNSEEKQLSRINDTQRGLIYLGEIIRIDDVYYVKRYRFEISDTTEIAITTGIKNLIEGIKKYNRRIAGPTQVASMTHIEMVPRGKADEEVGTSKRFKMELSIQITWSVG